MSANKRKPPRPVTPGTGSKFLCENYRDLPEHPELVLQGHVLHQFIVCNKSRALTIKQLLIYLKSNENILAIPEECIEELSRKLKLSIQKVSTKFGKFKNLTCPRQMNTFSEFCNEPMPLDLTSLGIDILAVPSSASNPELTSPTCAESQASAASLQVPEMSSSQAGATCLQGAAEPPGATVATASTSKSPVKTRQRSRCQSCRRYRQKLEEVHANQKKLVAEEKAKVIATVRAQQHKKHAVKILKQKVQRRDNKIKKIESSDMSKELSETKVALSSAEKRNYQMKRDRQISKSRKTAKKLIPTEQESALRQQVGDQSHEIQQLQHDKMLLEEELEQYRNNTRESKADGKTYSATMRMLVYDTLVNQVPTSNISPLLESFSTRMGVNLTDIPHRTTVEAMTRELGAIAELQTAEVILDNNNCTLGFDATTQEGTHINSIHVTTESRCLAVAVDELAGGTAADYHQHIVQSVDSLASVYCHFNEADYSATKQKLIGKISNSLTDRCAANHATVQLLNQTWNTSLNELNCHLHPLDSLSTKTRSKLKKLEVENEVPLPDRPVLYGSDCVAGKIVLAFHKLRYKDGKGDPSGFKVFLDNENLPRGLIPRYRGNRLHVIFHTCGILRHHYDTMKRLLEKGTACGGLRTALFTHFSTTTANVELQILGLIGKLVTGPWMRQFYRGAKDQKVGQINHLDGVAMVRDIVDQLKNAAPLELLSRRTDFFGNILHEKEEDKVLKSLMEAPLDEDLFVIMMKACLEEIVAVIERQYKKYFDCDVTDELVEATKSARCHNIDAEEIMGMFSAAQKKSPNATICFISCKMRAQKNRTVQYLDEMSEERREKILKKVVALGQKQRRGRRMRQKDLMAEMVRREAEKQQARDTGARKKVEKKLKSTDIDKLEEEFGDIGSQMMEDLTDLMQGNAVGKKVSHVWVEDGGKRVMYSGRIIEVKGRGKKDKYVVTYWLPDEAEEDGEDYEMTTYELGADLIEGDLLMSDVVL